jgi:histidinol phosphatase-like PHP family hydrolase
MYKDAGGELITVGSDAHAPVHAGDVSVATELAAEVGLARPVVFKRRNPIL